MVLLSLVDIRAASLIIIPLVFTFITRILSRFYSADRFVQRTVAVERVGTNERPSCQWRAAAPHCCPNIPFPLTEQY